MLFIRLDPALWRRTLHFFREPDRGGLTKTKRGKKAYGALTNLSCSYNARQVFRQGPIDRSQGHLGLLNTHPQLHVLNSVFRFHFGIKFYCTTLHLFLLWLAQLRLISFRLLGSN